MYDYLISLQEKYEHYKNNEEDLRLFLEKYMPGNIDNISIVDGKVNIATTERCRGCTYNETYSIPFSYFENVETFVSNYMKFRD
jgi:hypothetical protein